MSSAIIDANGRLDLSSERLRQLGFMPGAVVQVIPTLAGNVILALDNQPVLAEARARALPMRERRALGAGR